MTSNRLTRFGGFRGFSLIELIVVIGLVAALVAMVMPMTSAVRRRARSTVCKSNLHQIGLSLLMYANNNRGWLFPVGRGSDVPPQKRWPVYVFQPAVWNPPIMLCPDDLQPQAEHSYILNSHLPEKHVKYGTALSIPISDVVVMGEKVSDRDDYYMEDLAGGNEFYGTVELFRHGAALGSNYLYLDLHVSSIRPEQPPGGVDPWDFPGQTTTKPTAQ